MCSDCIIDFVYMYMSSYIKAEYCRLYACHVLYDHILIVLFLASCGQPSEPDGVIHSIKSNSVETYTDVTCETGFTLNGDARVYCNAGVWDTLPNCGKKKIMHRYNVLNTDVY